MASVIFPANEEPKRQTRTTQTPKHPTYTGNVKVAIVYITPEIAEAMLVRNTQNRSLRETAMQRIAHDILADKYILNGESIKICTDGTIIDGQHRLWAIVTAGKGVWSVVVTDLPMTAQQSVDRTLPRNLADALRQNGEKNSNVLAGAISHSIVLKSDKPWDINHNWPSTSEGLDYLVVHPEVRAAVGPGETVSNTLKTPSVTAAAMYHVLAGIDEEDANYFFDKLATGADLASDSPILRLRSFMLSEIGVQRRVNRVRLHAYWIKCWNAYRQGKPMTNLRWATGGSHPEVFPKPI